MNVYFRPIARAGVGIELKILTGDAARADRASKNFLESFPIFAAAVLALAVQSASDSATALGAEL
jgi:uncharacterized MAPEG superfamily protein